MGTGGANLILFVLGVGFFAIPLGVALAVMVVKRRTRWAVRLKWAAVALLVPILLVALASLLGQLGFFKSNVICGLSAMSLYVVAWYSPFVVLEEYRKRFPK